jgi:RHS repeat-associated protein
MLQTMPGDRFNISVDAFYEGGSNPEEAASVEDVVGSLMGALTGGSTYAGIPVVELPDNVRTITTALNHPELLGQLDNLINSNHNPNAPKAHLNYLFFNDKLELQPGNSGVVQVPVNPMGWVAVTPAFSGGANAINGQVTAEGAGWVIIYIDNQTLGKDVWFDNLMVGLYKGEVTEEDHYYPFGLTLNTSLAQNVTKNDIKFQNQRHEDDFGINMYSFKYRDHDPQIGRFWEIDPLSESYVHNSTYAFSENKVTNHIELEGLEAVPSAILWRSAGISSSSEPKKFVANVGKETLKPSTWGAAATIVSQAVIGPLLIGFMTEGVLAGTAASSEVSAVRSVRTASPSANVSLAPELEGAPVAAAETKPNFIVDGAGTAYPVPEGASGPTPTNNGKGIQYTGGEGGTNGQVSTMRVMDPRPTIGKAPAYPDGVIIYENPKGQAVNPYTGRTGSRAETHIPIQKNICELNPLVE